MGNSRRAPKAVGSTHLALVVFAAMPLRLAAAQTPPPAPPVPPAYAVSYPYEPTRPPPPPLDAHTHSGFFLRMSAGTGYMGDAVSLSEAGYAGDVTVKGPAATFEIDIGGSLVPGFSLSGAFLLHAIANATLSNDSRTSVDVSSGAAAPSRLDQNPQLSLLGLMADFYPNPGKGFHAGGILAYATMQARRGDQNNGSSDGFGLAPHAGYEWWVGDYWGLGVLGRILYSRTRSPYDTGRQIDRVVTVTVAFSATYN
jgi:hypothetical protein